MRISVVIPVLNAERYLPRLLDVILAQKPAAPDEILLLDSMSTDRTREIAATFARVRVIPVKEFSHGGTRNMGAREARGDLVVLMTQDALPEGDAWLAALIQPFADPLVAATYSRQVPYPEASPMEQYFLMTHFPPEAAIRTKTDAASHLGFQDVFFSNVSAAIRRELMLKFPFDENLIMSEDQQMSRDLMDAGFKVVYQPASVVIHSHNYTLKEVFKRYFDSVHSLVVIFPRHTMKTSANMGLRYLGHEFVYIARHHPATLPYYFLYTAAKTLGTILGHFADRLPRSWVSRMSMHSYHWRDRPNV